MSLENNTKDACCEKENDFNLLSKVENNLVTLIRGTMNASAIDELTRALAHVRHAQRSLDKFGVNFYKGMGQ